MWSLLGRKTQITIAVVAAVLLVSSLDALASLIFGYNAPTWRWISLAVFIISAVLVPLAGPIWFKLCAFFPTLQRMVFPDFNGSWDGHLLSTWLDPATGKTLPPISAKVVIRQNLFTTHVSLSTEESTSESTRAFLEAFPERRKYRVWYSYNNDPKAQVRHKSSPHEGVAFLEMDWDASKDQIEGRYYTARRTTGDMNFSRAR